ncbi:MAG: DUF5686 family protein [Chitinophagaceae bacterium]
MRFGISDNINLKLAGKFNYRLAIGGFINTDSVSVQDYIHFNGNKYLLAAAYLNSFQLAPYYLYSNKEKFYSTAHAEYHLNGLLTNKIPGFRRLNWYLIGGANTFYVNNNNNYVEAFVGFENIFKIIRVDFVQACKATERNKRHQDWFPGGTDRWQLISIILIFYLCDALEFCPTCNWGSEPVLNI